MTQTPLVTVGMPIFNCAETIEQALDAILAQSYQALEILISDNSSTDGTFEILQRIALTDKRIALFRQEANVGAPANFAWVASHASGEYFMWAAGDDLHDSMWVSALLRDSKMNRRASFGSVEVVDWDGHAVAHPSRNRNLSFTGSRLARRVQYFLRPTLQGKPNLAYSLMTTPQAQRFAPYLTLGGHGDIVGVFDLLDFTAIGTVLSVRLYKRLARPTSNVPPPPKPPMRTFFSLAWRTVFAKDLLDNSHSLERVLLVCLVPIAVARSALTLARDSNYKRVIGGFVDA